MDGFMRLPEGPGKVTSVPASLTRIQPKRNTA